MIWRTWLVRKVGGEYCLGEWEYVFSVNNQRYGRWGRSEEKRRYAVDSNQKLTKNWFLVCSFLTFWLAGPFCQNFVFSTILLEDGFSLNGILSGEILLFCKGTGSVFLLQTKGLRDWGRSEEERRCAVNSKQKSTTKFLEGQDFFGGGDGECFFV